MHGCFSNCRKQFINEIPLRAAYRSIPRKPPTLVGFLAWPECKAIVVLGSKHNVPGARLFKQPGPFICVKKFCFKLICQLVVGKVSKLFLMIILPCSVFAVEAVLVPFCILSF